MFLVVCVSCETNENQPLFSLLITANVDPCEFRIFDSHGRQIAKDIVNTRNSLVFQWFEHNIIMRTFHYRNRKNLNNNLFISEGTAVSILK